MIRLQSPFGAVLGGRAGAGYVNNRGFPTGTGAVPPARQFHGRRRGKALLYDGAATRLREGRCLIRGPMTYFQLCAIEGGTLRAPAGEADDRSDAFALAIAAIDQTPRGRFEVFV
jgi:hypothetical protein